MTYGIFDVLGRGSGVADDKAVSDLLFYFIAVFVLSRVYAYTVLALDQGTTSSRAILFDATGHAVASAQQEFTQHFPQPGWVEHDAEELIANVLACLDAARGIDGIGAVGLANQGESCLAWDSETLKALGPVIVWQDDRSANDLEPMQSQTIVRSQRQGI